MALVHIHARLLSRLGGAVDDARRKFNQAETMSEGQARMTWVFAKNGGRWEIVAFQNTKIAEGINPETV